MFRMLRPAARSAFGVQNLCRRALHAAVRAEHAAIAWLGAQHLVATPALISQECRHGGHHHFPLRSAYRAGQDRNLDGSASHRAVNPRQEKCFRAAIKSLITVWSQSCTASRRNFVAAAAGLRRFPGGRVYCPALRPLPGTVDPRTRNLPQQRFATGKCFGLRNTLPADAAASTKKGSAGRISGVFGGSARKRRLPSREHRTSRNASSQLCPGFALRRHRFPGFYLPAPSLGLPRG